jgi:mono/diheme cytochrome c family protein
MTMVLHSWWTRLAIAVVLVAIALIAVRMKVVGDQASGDLGNASSGRQYAEAWCTECHSIQRTTARTGQIAPDFTAIADLHSTTALSLRVFLQSNHKTMPNFIIARRDTDDVIAYILSLRRNP